MQQQQQLRKRSILQMAAHSLTQTVGGKAPATATHKEMDTRAAAEVAEVAEVAVEMVTEVLVAEAALAEAAAAGSDDSGGKPEAGIHLHLPLCMRGNVIRARWQRARAKSADGPLWLRGATSIAST